MGDSAFLDAVAERVVVYDGATGTWLQTQDLSLDDYGGASRIGRRCWNLSYRASAATRR